MKKRIYLVILLIFFIPTLVGFLSNEHFSGMYFTTDGNTYLSFISQAREGRVLFTNMYTSEEVPFLLLRPTYLLAGWFSLLSGVSGLVAYHIFRGAGILLFVYFLERIFSFYFKKNEYNMALFFSIFASGFGYIFALLTHLGVKQYGSVDLWVADANNFMLLMSHPHTIFSLAFFAATVYFFLSWNRNPDIKKILFASFFGFLLGIEHLFDLLTIYIAIGFLMLHGLLEKKLELKHITHLLIFGAITCIPVIYIFIMFTVFPQFASWDSQNTLSTPKLLHVIFGYGLMFPAFIWMAFSNFKKKPEIKLMIFWILAVLLLIYLPLNIQRRFLEGVHIPFGILAALVFLKVYNHLMKTIPRYSKWVAAVALLFIAGTNIYHFVGYISPDNGRGDFPYHVSRFLEAEEHEALRWLALNAEPESIIFSTYNIGNYVPSYMNRRVYTGHWAQTIDFEKKSRDVELFYKGTGKLPGINKPVYIWYGIDETIINSEFRLESEPVFMNSKVTIYRGE
jgi:hypothetical protein